MAVASLIISAVVAVGTIMLGWGSLRATRRAKAVEKRLSAAEETLRPRHIKPFHVSVSGAKPSDPADRPSS